MGKEWTDIVKEKLDSYNLRRNEIDNSLKILSSELIKAPYNICMNHKLINENDLTWEVLIGKQTFTISEKEIEKKQRIKDDDCIHGLGIETIKKRDVKEALQEIIIEKIKSF